MTKRTPYSHSTRQARGARYIESTTKLFVNLRRGTSMTKTNLLEKDVKAEVKKILNAHEWFWWMPPNNGYGRSGISDFNAIKDHVFMAVETKKKKDMPTAMQTGFLGSIKAMGGFAFCVNERSIDYLDRFLNAYDRSVRATSIQQKPSL